MLRVMKLTLRPATKADWDFLYDLHRACCREPDSPGNEEWDEDWESDRFRVFTDLEQRQIVAVDGSDGASFSIVEHPAWLALDYLAVRPELQNQGIATRLFGLFLAEAQAKGVGLRVSLLRGDRALALAQRLGFRLRLEEGQSVHLEHPGGSGAPKVE